MRKAREAKEKVDAQTDKRARAWAEAKDKQRSEIARLAEVARDKADKDTRAKKKSNTARRVAEEAVAEIRVKAKVQIAKRERQQRLRPVPMLNKDEEDKGGKGQGLCKQTSTRMLIEVA